MAAIQVSLAFTSSLALSITLAEASDRAKGKTMGFGACGAVCHRESICLGTTQDTSSSSWWAGCGGSHLTNRLFQSHRIDNRKWSKVSHTTIPRLYGGESESIIGTYIVLINCLGYCILFKETHRDKRQCQCQGFNESLSHPNR